MNVTIRKIGNSEGVILPKPMLEKLRLKSGDQLLLVEDETGIRLVPASADLAEQIEAARQGMKKYRMALRELAK